VLVGGNGDGALALRHGDRNDLVVEAPCRDRRAGALLAALGEGVLVAPRHLPFGRHVLRGLGHRVGAVGLLHPRIDEPPPESSVLQGDAAGERRVSLVHHERRARHALDAAGNHQLHFTGGNGTGGDGDGIHARTAQPVDGRAGHLLRQPGEEQRHSPDVAIVFPRLIRAPVDDVVQPQPVHACIAVAECGDRDGGEVIRSHAGQSARVAAKRGSNRIAQVHRTDVNHGSDIVHFPGRGPERCTAWSNEYSAPPAP
jgi:hypothetical protein